jgi:hypothetical protein
MGRTSGGSGGGGGAGLLGFKQYAPATIDQVTLNSSALTALDTTNLTVGFTTTATGGGSTSVIVTLSASCQPGTSTSSIFGLLDHTSHSQRGDSITVGYEYGPEAWFYCTSVITITGLTANTAYQVDWAGYDSSGIGTVWIQGFTGASAPKAAPAVMQIYAGIN